MQDSHPIHQDFRAGDVRHSLADISKARRFLDYTPTHSVNQGLDEALSWYVPERVEFRARETICHHHRNRTRQERRHRACDWFSLRARRQHRRLGRASDAQGQFSMTIQASWPPRKWDEPRLRDGLQKLGASLRMEIRLSFVEAHRRQRFALLVTRETHAMKAVLAGCHSGELKAEPAVVVSNRSELRAQWPPAVWLAFRSSRVGRPRSSRVGGFEKFGHARHRFCRSGALHENSFSEFRVALQKQSH